MIAFILSIVSAERPALAGLGPPIGLPTAWEGLSGQVESVPAPAALLGCGNSGQFLTKIIHRFLILTFDVERSRFVELKDGPVGAPNQKTGGPVP